MGRIKGFDKYIEVDEKGAAQRFHEFEIGLARAALVGNDKNLSALRMLGQALTRRGFHHKAVEVDRRITQLNPKDPTAHYNLACSYSNVDDLDSAFDALKTAFKHGYHDYKFMLKDPDLKNLRKDPRFRDLLNKRWGKRQP